MVQFWGCRRGCSVRVPGGVAEMKARPSREDPDVADCGEGLLPEQVGDAFGKVDFEFVEGEDAVLGDHELRLLPCRGSGGEVDAAVALHGEGA